MSEICIHDNVKSTCSRCKSEQCWQLMYDVTVNDRITYYLREFYTGKTKKISKKYFTQLDKLLEDKIKYNTKLCNCETSLQEIIYKAVNK